MDNNVAIIAGKITEEFKRNTDIKIGKELYSSWIEIVRDSGTIDRIMILVEESLLEPTDYINKRVGINGRFSSYNKHGEEKTKLLLFIYVEDIRFINENIKDMNVLYMTGYVCKDPVHRITPLGKEITDLHLAVKRNNNSSDYIPCIAWGKNAKTATDISVGTEILVKGRVQSRTYTKRICEREVDMVAYEVSINEISVKGSQ